MTRWSRASADTLLNASISKLANLRTYDKDLFGIELENELDEDEVLSYEDIKYIRNCGFRVDKDGSLRGTGYEFISGAYNIPDLKEKLEAVCAKAAKYQWSYSRRTSTHIHINFTNKKLIDLVKFATVYWLFEPLLFATVRPQRLDNTFCVPSIYTRDKVLSSISKGILLKDFAEENNDKYASLNFAPLWKIGTVECRVFHSSFNPVELSFWLDFLYNMLIYSRKHDKLADIRKDFLSSDIADFCKRVLGDGVYAKLPKVAVAELVREGFRRTIPLYKLDESFSEATEYLVKAAEAARLEFEKLGKLFGEQIDLLEVLEGKRQFVAEQKLEEPEVEPEWDELLDIDEEDIDPR